MLESPMIDIVLWVGGVELNIPSIFPIVDVSGRDGPIVQTMFVLRGNWQFRMRSMGICPSSCGLSIESLSVQGCREKTKSSLLCLQNGLLTGLPPKTKAHKLTSKGFLVE
jgi:hypothetical protein